MSKDEEVNNKLTSTTTTTSASSSEDVINPCPICLSSFVNESLLDKCFHRFCFNCIVQWSRVVSGKHSRTLVSLKCPLCKVENLSIIHGFDGTSFQQYYINQDLENRFVFSKEHKYRLQCYYTEPGLLSDVFNVSRYWKSRKFLQPNRWLLSWLRREIQALMKEEDVDVIMHHIHGVIDSFVSRTKQQGPGTTAEAKRVEFHSLISDAASPFLAVRTERFVSELELFLASGLTIEAFDDVCKQRLGWSELPGGGGEAEDVSEHRGAVMPYLFIFDENSDGSD